MIALGILLLAGWRLLRGGVDMLHHSRDSRMMGVVFIAFVAAFCMDGMVDFPLLTPKLVGIFLMVLALGDAAGKLYLDQAMQPLTDTAPFSRIARFIRKHREKAYANMPLEK